MNTADKGLFLLIDESGSMDNSIHVAGRWERKINHVERNVRSWLDKNADAKVHCYGFSETVEHKFSLTDHRYGIPPITFRCEGNSFIWDSIDQLLDQISPHSSSALVCLTDGQDTHSRRDYSHVVEKAKSKDISLQIIIIDDQEAVEDFEKIIRPVKDPEEIRVELEKSMGYAKTVATTRKRKQDISAVVLPLIETSDNDIRMVQNAVAAALPYLESLINVRYYPVPTLIVDNYTIQKLRMVTFSQKEPLESDLEDLIELTKFLYAVCLTVHVGAFDKDLRGQEWYPDYTRLSQKARRSLWCFCEGCCGLMEYLDKLKRDRKVPKEEEPDVFIRELSPVREFIENSKADLTEVLNILKKASRGHQGEIVLSDDYFRFREIDEPKLDPWDRHLGERERKQIRECLIDGIWKKDINSVIVAYEITLNLVFSLLPRVSRSLHPAWPIMQEIHTYGVYLWRSKDQNPKLTDILRKSGFPTWFHLSNTGAAVICLERIRERFASVQETTPEISMSLEDLVTATVVHEHAHAAISEGIAPTRSHLYGLMQFAGNKKFEPVNESLAEWAELNFFRDNDEMYQLILGHAESDHFPQWPYRGAVILENEYQRSEDFTCFRTLVDWIGKDAGKAFDLLKGF